jgi:hypothetical protein
MICIGGIDWVTSYEVIKCDITVVLHWIISPLCLVDGAEAIVLTLVCR